MSGLSNFDSFRDGGVGGRIAGALWGVAARTYSILLATFLCNCRLASSQAVLLASKWCIHTAVSTRLLPNAHKTEYMCFNQAGDISTLEGPL